jgi:hypothetical protein
MPDINLDSLFIIGLILASLIGKILKKGDPEEKQRGKEKKEPSLEDVIKEAWQKATNPEQIVKSEVEPSLPPNNLPTNKVTEIENTSTVLNNTSNFQPIVDVVPKPKSPKERGVWHSVPQNEISVKKNAYKELLSSKSSLQQAFILKEILGKPVSLRPKNQ